MEDKYIISLNKLPHCIYRDHNDIITQFAFCSSLIPNNYLLKKGERYEINGKYYIIKDRIDIMNFIILKCIEEE